MWYAAESLHTKKELFINYFNGMRFNQKLKTSSGHSLGSEPLFINERHSIN